MINDDLGYHWSPLLPIIILHSESNNLRKPLFGNTGSPETAVIPSLSRRKSHGRLSVSLG